MPRATAMPMLELTGPAIGSRSRCASNGSRACMSTFAVTTPSGANSNACSSASATKAATPATPSPLGRLSTTTGCFHRRASCGASRRAARSVLVPGGDGTTIRTARSGHRVDGVPAGEHATNANNSAHTSRCVVGIRQPTFTATPRTGRFLPAPGRTYASFAAMTRSSSSNSVRRSAAERQRSIASCAASASGRCAS